jgi:hypothetical protein
MNILRRIPFHPFLLAVYPILALLAHNMGQVYPWMAVRSIVLSLLGTAVFFLLLWLIFRDWRKAALPTSLLVLMLFIYGHIYTTIEQVSLLGINLGRHRYLIPAMLLLLVVLLIWVARSKQNSLGTLTQVVNIIALILIAFPLVQVTWYQITQASARQAASATGGNPLNLEGLSNLTLSENQQTPDVYYIILDAYGRNDTLQNYFGYDNSPFINRLKELGFWVAQCSQSNYSSTEYSITSSLNMDYLENLNVDVTSSSALAEMIHHSAVRQAFEKLGYRIVAYESGYSSTEIRDADSYYSPNLHPGRANYLGGINAFEALLLRTSIGFLIYERYNSLPDNIKTMLSAAYNEHRGRILYTFDELEQVASTDGPKLVFAHILAPHEPFVFGADGQQVVRRTPFTLNHDPETTDPNEYARGYTNQLTYINQRAEQAIQAILANSSTPPIIILQGDHGPLFRATSPNARMTNLVAIYLPPGAEPSSQLYDSITPVNIFRLILDSKFGASLGQIEDTSYFAQRGAKPGEFTIIPNDCR